MDLYEQQTFDEWLGESTKEEILNDLRERWIGITNGNAIFISALERTNIDQLRQTILDKVRDMYRVRYPYKTDFLY
jgi:GTP-binding protein HflX